MSRLTQTQFRTQPQVMVSMGRSHREGVGELTKHSARGLHQQAPQYFDEMLRDPTIRLACNVIIAMMQRQAWSIVATNDAYEPSAARLLEALNEHRETILRSSFRGLLRDGWRTFEVVYKIDPDFGDNTIEGVKPLRTDNTDPLAYEDTGEFAGVINIGEGNASEEIEIDENHCIFVNFDDEGYGDLGEALLHTAYLPYKRWEDCDIGARRYDQKIAGGFLLVEYPTGSSPFNSSGAINADPTENAIIARQVAESFESAGYACVPRNVDPDTGEPLPSAWNVKHIAASGGAQSEFITREKYLDALKLRAFGIPERAATEGTFGTKAEAEAHADIAVLINLDRHERIVQAVNRTIMRALNIANFNDPGACRLVLGRLDPVDRELFTGIFQSLMSDPMFGERIASQVDVETLLQNLNVPIHDVGETQNFGQDALFSELDITESDSFSTNPMEMQ